MEDLAAAGDVQGFTEAADSYLRRHADYFGSCGVDEARARVSRVGGAFDATGHAAARGLARVSPWSLTLRPWIRCACGKTLPLWRWRIHRWLAGVA